MGKDFDETGKLITKGALHLDEKLAKKYKDQVKTSSFTVDKIETKSISRSPKPPFITSTLQQEASRKLNLTSRQTMSLAQKLYEKGWITYMRTDSLNMSKEAYKAILKSIEKKYGKSELAPKVRYYKTKNKQAQEAHEAIRPSGSFKSPEESKLAGQELSLYKLIWQRTLASPNEKL